MEHEGVDSRYLSALQSLVNCLLTLPTAPVVWLEALVNPCINPTCKTIKRGKPPGRAFARQLFKGGFLKHKEIVMKEFNGSRFGV